MNQALNTNSHLITSFRRLSPTTDAKRLKDYWMRLWADNLIKTAFFMGEVKNYKEFVQYARRDDVQMFMIYDPNLDIDVGHIHLNQFSGRSAHFHFAALKRCWGDDTEFEGRTMVRELFGYYTFAIDTLIGIIPASNRMANIFAYRVGFRKTCSIPNYFGDIHGNMYLFTREDL